MMKCPLCNGTIVEIDKYGTEEECELCGTIYRIRPMENDKDESTE